MLDNSWSNYPVRTVLEFSGLPRNSYSHNGQRCLTVNSVRLIVCLGVLMVQD